MVRIRIEASRRVNRTAEIGPKKLIKRPFEYDLKQNLAQGRFNRINLVATHQLQDQTVEIPKPEGHFFHTNSLLF